ncbi:MAG TPA: putative lipid II flippase FtsW [Patescibacteria group bacterium]|nr:putative lipid II flippase FtsW [Patescibacteria group bacterium]
MLKPRSLSLKIGDRWFFFFALILSIFGLFMIFDASSVTALADFGDKFYYLKHQSIWLVLGLVLFFFFAFLDYRLLKKIALPFLLLSFAFLLAVLIPGIGREIYGGRRWLQIGPLGFQPGELIKLSLVIYLATFFEKKRSFSVFVAVVGLSLALLLLEPDLGTATIIAATAFGLYFIAGAPWKEVLSLGVAIAIVGPILIWFSPYRRQRLLSFLNSSWDAQDASYHIRQVLIALGSGGIFGRGLGQSRQKFLFLPEVTTDSIFAVIAEEFGFLGAGSLVFLFLILVLRGMRLAIYLKDRFAQLLVAGIIFSLGFQAIVNLGAMVALVPLTGVPLPFISYGGSSLLVSLSGMGIVYNISKNSKR